MTATPLTLGGTWDDLPSLADQVALTSEDPTIAIQSADEGWEIEGAAISDPSENVLASSTYDVTIDLSMGELFTVVMLPDTQNYSQSYPEQFTAQTQWIAGHVDSDNLAFVTHTGDLVQNGGGSAANNYNELEWSLADAAMNTLDGKIPYSAAIGNHDFDTVSSHYSADRYRALFGPSRYTDASWYKGSSEDELNHHQIFTVGDRQFHHITLEWEPRESAIAWAQDCINQNPDLPVILSTHSYLAGASGRSTSTTTSDGLSGEEIFQRLVKPNPQIFMVLCGHQDGEVFQVSTNDAGREVFEIMADYQSRSNGGNGWMRLMEFLPLEKRIDVETYSPTLDQYETDANSQFSISIDFNARFDFTFPPTAAMASPEDNGILDLDPAIHSIEVAAVQPMFAIQLSDVLDDIDDNSVSSQVLQLSMDGIPLAEGANYSFAYDPTADLITLSPIAGQFDDGLYQIDIIGGAAQIADFRGNAMAPTTITMHIDTSIVVPQVVSFQQSVGEYQGTHDTMLNGSTPAQNYASIVEVNADTDSGGSPSHALFRFDDIIGTSPGQIPPGAMVQSATLRLRATDDGNGGNLHPILLPWEDTVVTWDNSFGGNGIQADNKEAASVADDGIAQNLPGTYVDFDATATLQAWVDGAVNNGWAVLPNGTNGWHIATAEHETVGYRPELIVVFFAPVANDSPMAVDDPYTIAEDGTLAVDCPSGVLANDAAADGDGLTAILLSGPASGLLALESDGSFVYEPNANFNGTDSFTYKANDGTADSNVATVTITVNPLNDAPFVDQPITDLTVDEDAVDRIMSLLGVFADVDILTNGDALSYALAGNDNPGVVSASLVDDDLTLDFLANQHGTANITVRATDSCGASVEQTFCVTVQSVNDGPVVISPISDVGVNQDAPDTVVDLSGVFDDADIATDRDLLTLGVANDNPGLVTASLQGSVLTLAYATGQSGQANIIIRATDSASLGMEDSFLVTVRPLATDDRAVGESTLSGTVVSGNRISTEMSDNTYEAIREVYAGQRSRLEHVWHFDVTGGSTVTFYAEAYHDSAVEDFVFEYSTNGTNWTRMFAIGKNADDNSYQTYELPATTAGPLSVRVTDTDRSSRERSLDTVYIDHLFIRSSNVAALPVVTLTATDAVAGEQGPDPGTFTVTRSGSTVGNLAVSYTIAGTATAGVDYAALSGTVVITDGSSSATITITPIDDSQVEDSETVILALADNAAYVIGSSAAGTVTISDNDGSASDDHAIGQTPVSGTVTGELAATWTSNDSYQAVQEELYNRTRSLLEHRWQFDVTGGSSVAFYVEAYHNSVVEDFVFEYSTDGVNWTTMLTVAKNEDDDAYQTCVLQNPVSGTVWVRVVDTNRSKGEPTQDTLFIDDMFFRSE